MDASSVHIQAKRKNSAIDIVILHTDMERVVTVVTEKEFHNEKVYQSTMSIMKSFLNNGHITKDEYAEFDKIMTNKYRPYLGILRSEIACNLSDSE